MNRATILLLAGGLNALMPATAFAETLADALALACRTNPVLRGQQANQRATDETAVQARSGWRPVVTASVSSEYARGPFDPYDYAAGTIETNDAQAAITVTQPLYTGGRVANAVRAADTRVQAGQQGLRLAEAQTLQAVISAYMDVLRDQDILAVRRADLQTLRRQVAETISRFDLGASVTRTDVAQAGAQRDAAAATLADAQAELEASRANYRTVVGVLPGLLVQPETLPGLPATLAGAMAAAKLASPALAQSRLMADASTADIAAARSGFRPTIGMQGSFGYVGPVAPFHGHSYDQQVIGLVTLTQPLFAGGLLASQLRQAKDRNEADRQAAENADRQTVQAVLTSWSQVRAGFSAKRANEAQVRSATTALRGYQLEYGYGLRSTLDVLIADQNLRSAQVSLAISRDAAIVAEASLLAVTGRLEARWLLPGEPSDPRPALHPVRQAGSVPWDSAATFDRAGGG